MKIVGIGMALNGGSFAKLDLVKADVTHHGAKTCEMQLIECQEKI